MMMTTTTTTMRSRGCHRDYESKDSLALWQLLCPFSCNCRTALLGLQNFRVGLKETLRYEVASVLGCDKVLQAPGDLLFRLPALPKTLLDRQFCGKRCHRDGIGHCMLAWTEI